MGDGVQDAPRAAYRSTVGGASSSSSPIAFAIAIAPRARRAVVSAPGVPAGAASHTPKISSILHSWPLRSANVIQTVSGSGARATHYADAPSGRRPTARARNEPDRTHAMDVSPEALSELKLVRRAPSLGSGARSVPFPTPRHLPSLDPPPSTRRDVQPSTARVLPRERHRTPPPLARPSHPLPRDPAPSLTPLPPPPSRRRAKRAGAHVLARAQGRPRQAQG